MPVTVRNVTIWRKEVDNTPGVLAVVLEPLAKAGADLKVLMGYRLPGEESKAAVEIYPVNGRKTIAAARAAGLSPSTIPALHVEGDDKPGLAHALAAGIAMAGINITFLVAQVVGRKCASICSLSRFPEFRAKLTWQCSVLVKNRGRSLTLYPGSSIPGSPRQSFSWFRTHFSHTVHPAAVDFRGVPSACLRQRLGLASRQPRDHPQIVRQHAPGDLPLLIPMPLAQQRTAQESVLEN
jgi:hypothetical protein